MWVQFLPRAPVLTMKINQKQIRKIAKGRFSKAPSCHDWEHVERVYVLAQVLAKKEKADLNIVQVSALLHDIKRAEEMAAKGRICHAAEGAREAERILLSFKLPKDFIQAVKHCIAAHRFRNYNKPKTLEAKVLSDADKLDALGAIGVGRGFMWCGYHGLSLYDTNKKIIIKNDPYQRTHNLYAEYMIKLRYLKDKMYTKTGKKMAQERTDFMKKFIKRLDLETKGTL